jgi:uncharacterized metal-binding protein YceD (DUF177 family)
MKIHLRQIPQGGTLHVEDVEDPRFLELEEIGARAVSPVRYALDVGLSGGGIFATGRVGLRIRFKCVACLNEFETDVVIDPFALQKELDRRESVDLTPEIREDIHLALPAHPRCDADGRKICSGARRCLLASRQRAMGRSGQTENRRIRKLRADFYGSSKT